MKAFTRAIKNKADASRFITWLGNVNEYPITVNVIPGEEKRSSQQNRLQHKWFNEAEAQGDMRAHEYRAECKLLIGCKLLYEENEVFREAYNRVLRGLTYEQQLACMIPPFDMPVTSTMTVKQKSKYLDQMHQYLRGKGFELTDPSMMGLDQYREAR